MDPVVLFPRGSQPAGNAKKRPQRPDENLFGSSKRLKSIEVKKSSKKSNTSLTAGPPPLGLGIAAHHAATQTKVKSVTARNFQAGCLTLAIVLSHKDDVVTVSLPGGCVGKIRLVDLCDCEVKDASSVIKDKEIIRCVVLENDSKSVQLSSRCSLVNRGLAYKHLQKGMSIMATIKSKEDHGYIVQTGVSGANCFIPIKEMEKRYGQANICPGKLLNCVVRSINHESRAVTLIPFKAAAEDTLKTSNLPFLSLIPGMLFDVVVEKIVEDGLFVSYLSLFHGLIDVLSLANSADSEWAKQFSVGQILKARVTFIDQVNKIVRLSTKSHVLQLASPTDFPTLGSIASSLTIRAIHKGFGLILTSESNSMAIILTKSHLPPVENSSTQNIWDNYTVGQEMSSVRVKGYHLLEGMTVGSAIPGDLDNNVLLHYSEVRPGQLFTATIKNILDSGLAVQLEGRINAFCPLQHTADLVVEGNLRKRFKRGQALNVRVWEAADGKILVTNKRSLVEESDCAPVVDCHQVVDGSKAIGVVQKIDDSGVMVRFFNRIRGLLSSGTLSSQSIHDPQNSFRLGQIVKVVFLDTIKDSKEVVPLALDIGVDSIEKVRALRSSSQQNELFKCGTIYNVEDDIVHVRLDDGRNVRVAAYHFYDFAQTAAVVKPKVGDRIERVWVMESSDSAVIATSKPLLLHAIEDINSTPNAADALFPADLAALTPGQIVVGYVSKVESYGVVVKFQGNLSALAPRPNIADKFISSPVGLFEVGDSVRCMIQRVDLSKGRIFVTLKPSLISSSSGSFSYLSSFLRESFLIATVRSQATLKSIPDWKAYPLGSTIVATVTSIEDYGTILTASDNATVMLDVTATKQNASSTVGQSVNVLLLDVDFENCVFEARILDRKIKKKKDKTQLSAGTILPMVVQAIKGKYAIVTSADFGMVGYLALADYHCPQGLPIELACGASISAVVDKPPSANKGAMFPHENSLLLRMAKTGDDSAAVGSDVSFNRNLELNCKVGSRGNWVVTNVAVNKVTLSPERGDANVSGCIDISNAVDSFAADDSLRSQLDLSIPEDERKSISAGHPFSKYRVGQVIRCQVLQLCSVKPDESDSRVFLRPVSDQDDHNNSKNKNSPFMLQCWGRDAVKSPSVWPAVVISFDEYGCVVALSPYIHAPLPYIEVSSDVELVERFKNECFVGLRVVVAVTDVTKHSGKVKLQLSRVAIEDLLNGDTDLFSMPPVELRAQIDRSSALQVGKKVFAQVNLRSKFVSRPPAVMVALPCGRVGRICASEVADQDEWKDFQDNGGLTHGELLHCRVLTVEQNHLELSARSSRLETKSAKAAIKDDPAPSPGSVVKGYIVSIGPKGCFVRISSKVTGRVLLKDLADEFIEKPEDLFPCGKLVNARVRSVNGNQIQLSLRASELLGSAELSKSLCNIREGDVMVGKVRRVIPESGVFVEIDGTGVVGLARKEQALSNSGRTLQDEYSVGDIVRAKVLRVNMDTGKVALGLKDEFFKSYVQALPAMQTEEMEVVEDEPTPVVSTLPKKSTKLSTVFIPDDDDDSIDNPISWEDNDKRKADKAGSDSDSESEDDASEKGAKNRPKHKEGLRKREEQLLREKERLLSEASGAPQRPDDFERLLLEKPNSSLLWIQYMAYYVNGADIEAARLVAQRALKSIHFRESEEKFNVWLAWLNLEYKYGNKEGLEQTLKQAEAEANAKRIILAVAQMFDEAGDSLGAENLLLKALKKPQNKKSKKVWMALHRLQLKAGRLEAARDSLKRSMQSLSQHKHVETISKFALGEFDWGSADKARQLFEDLLEHYPKRTDLWQLYVDREVKLRNIQQARQLFERMIATKSSTRNMKLVFKKYLELETRYGDESSRQAVQEKAVKYLQSNN